MRLVFLHLIMLPFIAQRITKATCIFAFDYIAVHRSEKNESDLYSCMRLIIMATVVVQNVSTYLAMLVYYHTEVQSHMTWEMK